MVALLPQLTGARIHFHSPIQNLAILSSVHVRDDAPVDQPGRHLRAADAQAVRERVLIRANWPLH